MWNDGVAELYCTFGIPANCYVVIRSFSLLTFWFRRLNLAEIPRSLQSLSRHVAIAETWYFGCH
jgi:hypothetical protein